MYTLQHIVERAAVTVDHALHIGVTEDGLTPVHLSGCGTPVVLENLGGAAEDSVSIIRAIGRAIGQRSSSTDPDYSIASRKLFAHLAITVAWQCCLMTS
jgi:hypothetical protein